MKIIPRPFARPTTSSSSIIAHSSRTSNDGGKFAIGLEVEGALVGVAIVGRPVARMLQKPGTAELLRCCVSPAAPRCAVSKLNGRAKRIWQLMGGTRMVSYTLARESSASMRAAGFAEEADVAARRWDTPTRRRGARPSEAERKTRWAISLAEVPA